MNGLWLHHLKKTTWECQSPTGYKSVVPLRLQKQVGEETFTGSWKLPSNKLEGEPSKTCHSYSSHFMFTSLRDQSNLRKQMTWNEFSPCYGLNVSSKMHMLELWFSEQQCGKGGGSLGVNSSELFHSFPYKKPLLPSALLPHDDTMFLTLRDTGQNSQGSILQAESPLLQVT